jgi:hypothetical protein
MCRLSRKSGSLNLLEPSGPFQDCNGDFSRKEAHYIVDFRIYLYLEILQCEQDVLAGVIPGRGLYIEQSKRQIANIHTDSELHVGQAKNIA